MLSEAETEALLAELCIKLGFCLPPEARHLLVTTTPANVLDFTDAVFIADGFGAIHGGSVPLPTSARLRRSGISERG